MRVLVSAREAMAGSWSAPMPSVRRRAAARSRQFRLRYAHFLFRHFHMALQVCQAGISLPQLSGKRAILILGFGESL